MSLDPGAWEEPELVAQETPTEPSEGLSDSEGGPLSGVVVESTAGPEGALPLSAAAEMLGVSPRRARQFADSGRLVIVDTGPPMLVSHASVVEAAGARAESGQAVAVRPSKPLPAGDLAAVVDLIRAEHEATLAAMTAQVEAVESHRDALAAQVKDLRAEVRRERAAADRERKRADELAAAEPSDGAPSEPPAAPVRGGVMGRLFTSSRTGGGS